MADLSITASQVIKGTNAITKSGIAGEAITAGQTVYVDTANSNVIKLADADNTALTATMAGVTLHAASTSQPIEYQTAGDITLGAAASMTVAEIYLLSDTAGGIAPEADLATSLDWVSLVGVATSASVLSMKLFNSGAQIP